MFTGIIEAMGEVVAAQAVGTNIRFTVQSPISDELHVDQSLSHDGVCLTVVATGPGWHQVDAIDETLQRSTLGTWHKGTLVNLERAMKMGERLDGHLVQGHVDTTVECLQIEQLDGSAIYTFALDPKMQHLVVQKGSVCINGISLTVVDPTASQFSVAIIPYTAEYTNIGTLEVGSYVNIEFDIVGKYLEKMAGAYLR